MASSEENIKSDEEKRNLAEPDVQAELLVPSALSGSAQIVSPIVSQLLAQKAPKELLKLAESSDERQANYHLLKENNRHQERVGEESTKRIGMGLLALAFSATLIYSGLTSDKALPEKLINTALAAFGGAGALAISSKSKSKNEE